MYEIRFKSNIQKELRRLGEPQGQQIIEALYSKLACDPKQGKPLKGKHKGLWRYRVGNYRIIYTFNDKELWILVLEIDHRKDVYKDH